MSNENEEIIPFTLEEAKAFYISCGFNGRELIDRGLDSKRYYLASQTIFTPDITDQWRCEYMEEQILKWPELSEKDIANSYSRLFYAIPYGATGYDAYRKYIVFLIEYLDNIAEFADQEAKQRAISGFVNRSDHVSTFVHLCIWGDYAKVLCQKLSKVVYSVKQEVFWTKDKAIDNLMTLFEYVQSEEFDKHCEVVHTIRQYTPYETEPYKAEEIFRVLFL